MSRNGHLGRRWVLSSLPAVGLSADGGSHEEPIGLEHMRARTIFARAAAVGATAVVIATGLPTASWAAGSASVISGSPVLNEGSHTAVFGTTTPYPPSPVGPDVELVRHADSSDTIDDSSSSVDSNGHVVATFDLSNANPGSYDVNIGQANTQTWSDQCTSCF